MKNVNEILEYMSSEEGLQNFEEYFKKKIMKSIILSKKIHETLSKKKKKDRETLIKRLIDKHDERWEELCYSKNCQPYPWNLMNYLFVAAQNHGEPHEEKLDDFDRHFGTYTSKYFGYYFNWIQGQGAVLRIFDKKGVEIFRS